MMLQPRLPTNSAVFPEAASEGLMSELLNQKQEGMESHICLVHNIFLWAGRCPGYLPLLTPILQISGGKC